MASRESSKSTATPNSARPDGNTSNSKGDALSDYAFLKNAGYKHFNDFMQSYGLRVYEPDDIEEAKAILRGLKEVDRK